METLTSFVWLSFTFLFGFSAHSEYRAYKLIITNSSTGAQRVVFSNFDPIQYRDLYPVLKEEDVTLEKSWFCPGDTSHKPICPDPDSAESLPKSDLN